MLSSPVVLTKPWRGDAICCVPSANMTTKEEEGIITIVKVNPTKNNAVVNIDKRGENDNGGFFLKRKISS